MFFLIWVHHLYNAISDRNGEIFIDDDHVNHTTNSVFTEKGIAVNTITMDGFMVENQIETVA